MRYKVRVVDLPTEAKWCRWVGYRCKCSGVMGHVDLNVAGDPRVSGSGLITCLNEVPRLVDSNPDMPATIRLDNGRRFVARDGRDKQVDAWASVYFDSEPLSLETGIIVRPRPNLPRVDGEMGRFYKGHRDEIWICPGTDAIFECHDANRPYSPFGIRNYSVLLTALYDKGAAGSMWLRIQSMWWSPMDGLYEQWRDSRMLHTLIRDMPRMAVPIQATQSWRQTTEIAQFKMNWNFCHLLCALAVCQMGMVYIWMPIVFDTLQASARGKSE